jgi:hypothetical protein
LSRSAIAIVIVVVALVAAVFLTLFATWIHATNCTGGDGGVPYVAGDSPQKSFCDATGDGWIVFLGSLVAVIGLGTLAVRRSEAWAAGVASLTSFAGLATLTALSPIVVLMLAGIPSSDCTGEQAAAYEAWRDAGGKGAPPHDCARY